MEPEMVSAAPRARVVESSRGVRRSAHASPAPARLAVALLVAASLCASAQQPLPTPGGAAGEGDPASHFVLKPYCGVQHLALKLKGLGIAQGYGQEPDSPSGDAVQLGGTFGTCRNGLDVGCGAALTVFDSDFRARFTDRRSWSPPGYGETYTYSRVARMDPAIWLQISLANRHGGTSNEVGVKLYRLGFGVEQGYDEWGGRQPQRSYSGSGLGYGVFHKWGENLAVDLGPFAHMKMGTGSATLTGVGVSVSF